MGLMAAIVGLLPGCATLERWQIAPMGPDAETLQPVAPADGTLAETMGEWIAEDLILQMGPHLDGKTALSPEGDTRWRTPLEAALRRHGQPVDVSAPTSASLDIFSREADSVYGLVCIGDTLKAGRLYREEAGVWQAASAPALQLPAREGGATP